MTHRYKRRALLIGGLFLPLLMVAVLVTLLYANAQRQARQAIVQALKNLGAQVNTYNEFALPDWCMDHIPHRFRNNFIAVPSYDINLGGAGNPVPRLTEDVTKSIARLQHVQTLELCCQSLDYEALAPLASLPQIEILSIEVKGQGDFDASFLTKLTSLQSLSITNDGLARKSPELLRALVGLRSLGIVATEQPDWSGLQSLTGLQSLSLTIENPSSPIGMLLPALPNLTVLNLCNARPCQMDFSGLQVDQLEELWIDLATNTGPIALVFPMLPQLKKLNVNSQTHTKLDLSNLPQAPQLECLYLRRFSLDDTAAMAIGRLTGLEDLSLVECNFEDRLLAHFSNLKKLSILSLNGTPINGRGLGELRRLWRLEVLDLSDTALSDETVWRLCGFSAFKLHLNGTKITDAGLNEISSLVSGGKIFKNGRGKIWCGSSLPPEAVRQFTQRHPRITIMDRDRPD